MSPEKAALLAAVAANPASDTPRLVYADWLDGDGPAGELDPGRAALIRVQCELVGLGWGCPAEGKKVLVIDGVPTDWGTPCGRCDHCRLSPDLLTAQARLLTSANRKRWWPGWNGADLWYEVRRGFAVEAKGPLDALLRHLPRLGPELAVVERVRPTCRGSDRILPGDADSWGLGLDGVRFGWCRRYWSADDSRNGLPEDLFRLLTGGRCEGVWSYYDSAADAYADLSAAVLSLCRGDPAAVR